MLRGCRRAVLGLQLVVLLFGARGTAHRLPATRVQRSQQRLHPRRFEPFAGTPAASLPPWLPPALARAVQRQPLAEALSAEPLAAGAAADGEVHRSIPTAEELLKARANFSALRSELHNAFDSIYTIDAEVGRPAASLRLVADTGSSDLWVLQGGGYAAERSSSAAVVDVRSQTVHYALGMVTGEEIDDRICLACVCLQNQSLMAVSTTNGFPPNFAAMFQGLLGLGYPALKQVQGAGRTVVETLSKRWEHFAFGLCLRGNLSAQESFISIGEMSDVTAEGSHCDVKGPGVVLPVLTMNAEAKFWMAMGGIKVGPTVAAPSMQGQAPMVFDSGSSYINIPAVMFPFFVDALIPMPFSLFCGTLAGQMACPCDVPLGVFSLSLPGENGLTMTVTLQREDLLRPAAAVQFQNGQQELALCVLTVQPTPMPFILLGDVFLRHVYAVHDVGAQQLTLFPQQQPADAGPNAGQFAFGVEQQPQVVVQAAIAFGAMAAVALLSVVLLRSRTAAAREDDGYLQF